MSFGGLGHSSAGEVVEGVVAYGRLFVGHSANAGEVVVEAHAYGGGSFVRWGNTQAGFVGGKAVACSVEELEESSAFGVFGEDVQCFACYLGYTAVGDGDEFVAA